jgi:hypothetical protein
MLLPKVEHHQRCRVGLAAGVIQPKGEQQRQLPEQRAHRSTVGLLVPVVGQLGAAGQLAGQRVPLGVPVVPVGEPARRRVPVGHSADVGDCYRPCT